MSVYVVAQLKFIDRPSYDRYQQSFGAVFRRFNGRVLVADEHPTLLEGSWDRDKVVIMSFPDEVEAKRFLEAPEYAEISKDRRAGADTIAVMVRGVPKQ